MEGENPQSGKSKALLLLFAAYIIVWIDLFLPQLPIQAFSPLWFIVSAGKNSLRIILVYFLMKKLGMIIKGPTLPKLNELTDTLIVASSAGVLALGIAGFAYLVGASNPLLASLPFPETSLFLYIAMLLSSIAIGYSEELFFRFFAVQALERAGLMPLIALLLSALLFGLSHSAQGLFGMAVSTILALLFSFFRFRGKSLHALALGHALYDFVILAALV